MWRERCLLNTMAEASESLNAEPSIDPVLNLREREVAAKEREIALKEQELKSRWKSPLVIALLATALGLVGNIAVAIINSRATLQTERFKNRTEVVMEIVRTGNKQQAIENLRFLLDT